MSESVFTGLPLKTARLLLRLPEAGDVAAMFAIYSDPRVMRYWSTSPWTSEDLARDSLARDEEGHRSGAHLRLALQRLDDGHLIGHCALFNISRACRRAEVGYGLAASAWGHGYMNEALGALLAYGFDVLDLNRVEADVDPRNERSTRTLRGLGFQQEGHLRERWIVGDEVSDSALYGLLRRDWRAAPETERRATDPSPSRRKIR